VEIASFSIRSSNSSRELIFSDAHEEGFNVAIQSAEVTASTGVWVYPDAQSLNELFQEIGSLTKPWKGDRQWVSIDKEFVLWVSCSALGHVTFTVELCGYMRLPEEWRVQVVLVQEFGQLEKIAKQANAFFSSVRT
jgi:hypothetical protein